MAPKLISISRPMESQLIIVQVLVSLGSTSPDNAHEAVLASTMDDAQNYRCLGHYAARCDATIMVTHLGSSQANSCICVVTADTRQWQSIDTSQAQKRVLLQTNKVNTSRETAIPCMVYLL